MAFLNSLILASTVALANNSPSVYLAEFKDKQHEIKTKISFHHALLATEKNGLLLELNEHEVSLLENKGIQLTPAAQQWQNKLNEIKKLTLNNNQTSGIPGFSCYATVEETFSEADKLINQYPDYAQWIDIGDSWQKQNGGDGYDLKVLQIGNKELVDPPILFIQSAMHAREYATAALTLDFAKTLLNNFETDPDINWILNRHQIHILLQTNPDGRKIAETGVSQRKNVNENHCDFGTVGVDLNRNFSFGWNTVEGGSSGNECNQTFRGIAPGSEPEVSALETYIRSIYPDVRGDKDTDTAPVDTKGLYLDIHSYSELILWPFGHSEALAPNNKGLKALGRKLAFFNGYDPMQSVGLYPTDGTSDNLAYGELGIAHITFELGTAFFQQCDTYENKIKPDNLKALLYAAKVVEAPYLMTSGPDIESIKITGVTDSYIEVDVLATDERFSSSGGSSKAVKDNIDNKISFSESDMEPTHNIKSVFYSVGDYPNEENIVQAEVKDGDTNSSRETFTARIDKNMVHNDQITLYFRAQDDDASLGPVTAKTLKLIKPTGDTKIDCKGAKCTFLAKESDMSYLWQLEDGRSSSNQEASFILPTLGNYTVNFSVTNSMGLTTEKSVDFEITEYLKPNVTFTDNCTDNTCQFDASATTDLDSEALTYSWDFGDSASSDSIQPEHNYENEGNYSVTLTVTDEHNQISTVTKEVTIQLNKPTGDLNINCTGAKCTFSATESDMSYLWQLEDGRSSLNQEASFILPTLGNYKVDFSVTNSMGLTTEKSVDFEITEYLKPIAIITTSCSEKTCQFDASTTTDLDSETLTYSWDFGDSTNSNLITVEHSYENAGNYPVTLTVTDEHNQTSIINKEVIISETIIPEPEEKQSSGGSLFYLLLVLLGIRKVRS
jgi:PKD repeat protein